MTLRFTVNKPIDFVFKHLTDMQRFVSVHPVITHIDNLGNNNYVVHETLKLGFIPLSFTYLVKIDSHFDDKTVRMSATVMKFTKIEMNFSIKMNGDVTEIEEMIHFTSPFPIKKIMENIFRKQHVQLFKNIEQV